MSENELNLIKMANQIARNIGVGASEKERISNVENHINLFWARPMREKICAALDDHGGGLSPTASKALSKVKQAL